MEGICVGAKVSKKSVPGMLHNGVVTRVDKDNGVVGVMWIIEGGLLAKSEQIDSLVIVDEGLDTE